MHIACFTDLIQCSSLEEGSWQVSGTIDMQLA